MVYWTKFVVYSLSYRSVCFVYILVIVWDVVSFFHNSKFVTNSSVSDQIKDNPQFLHNKDFISNKMTEKVCLKWNNWGWWVSYWNVVSLLNYSCGMLCVSHLVISAGVLYFKWTDNQVFSPPPTLYSIQ